MRELEHTTPHHAAAVADLVLCAAFVEPAAGRLNALQAAVTRMPADAWSAACAALEMHGILPLAARNLRLAGAMPPTRANVGLEARERTLREEAGRLLQTTAVVLDAAARSGIDVVLLKGASLATDVYPDARLRNAGDVDVWVPARRLRRLVAALAESGLVMQEDQLPLWWYELAHFHVQLHPAASILCPVEVHARLHDGSSLLTARHADLWRRRVPIMFLGRATFSLDPLDRMLHLATHLVRHGHGAGAASGTGQLRALAAGAAPGMRLKWVVDLQTVVEHLAQENTPASLADRAREWNGERPLAIALRLVLEGPALTQHVEHFVREAGAALETTSIHRSAPRAEAKSRTAQPAERPLAALGFRARSLLLLPHYVLPPSGYFRRRWLRSDSAGARFLSLLLFPLHPVAVLAFLFLAALLLPVAFAARALLRGARRETRALAPERMLDLAVAARQLRQLDGERAAASGATHPAEQRREQGRDTAHRPDA